MKYNLDDFIGTLSDVRARIMKRKITAFRKKFNDILEARKEVRRGEVVSQERLFRRLGI